MLTIENANNKKEWETFINAEVPEAYPLFQTWNWGEVQQKNGREIIRLKLIEEKQKKRSLVGVCQIILVHAKRGKYVHLRHGPVLSSQKKEYYSYLIKHIKSTWSGYSFIRMSPLVKREQLGSNLLKDLNFRSAPVHNMDAEICWVLDLNVSEEEILKNMRKTHRYLVRKAQTMDIEIIRTINISKIDNFNRLYAQLSQRKNFVPHAGISQELEIFGKDNEACMYLAKYKGKIIAGAIVLFVGEAAIYHHGASDSDYRDIPVSYLLQWEAIKDAIKKKKKLYNFWGITPLDAPSHPWRGLTLFKTGFGGRRVEFLHTQDLPFNLWYWKNYIIELFYKRLKGY